jgi:O-antigen/teichoic acid export membrane protein
MGPEAVRYMVSRFNILKDNVLRNKILIENFTFLSVLQVSNLVLFFITIPYLFRVLGSHSYGLIVFAQTIVYYFTIFTNFGFNLTATRDISINRNNHEKVTEIISSVLTIKVIFFLVSMFLMILLTMVISNLRENRLLYLLSMLACLSEALFPIWYFQGIEKMKYITFINVTTRILATILVFVIIDHPSKYYFYPLLLGIGTFSGAMAALFVVFQRHRVYFRFQSLITLKSYLVENVLYFLSNASTQIYVNANKIIVGSFLGMVEVAFYDVAEKVINIIKVPYSLIGQTLFPKVARDRNLRFLKRIMGYTIIFTILIILALFAFSSPVIGFFSGTRNVNSINILRILSISLVPISLNLFYGDLLLINFGLKKEYAKMRFFGLVFYVSIFLGLYIFKFIGAEQLAITIVMVEFFIATYSYILCRKASLNL